MQLFDFAVEPDVFLEQAGVRCPSALIWNFFNAGFRRRSLFSFSVFVFLFVIEFIIHVAFLNFSAALHKPLNSLMNVIIFPHLFELGLNALGWREVSKIVIGIILNEIFGIAKAFELS